MAKKTKNYLALDLGAESGRGIVGRFDGSKIALEEVYRFSQEPLRFGPSLHWDALSIAAHLRRALAAGVAKTRGDLASLAVDTWGVDYVLLDKKDRLLGYPHHYRDCRTDTIMPKVFKKISADRIFKTTGIQFMQLNTLFQLACEADSRTGVLDIAKTLLMMPDFLSYSLGGEKACEYTEASTTQMLNARKRTWDKGLLKKLDIPTKMLLPLTEPGTTLGTLRPEVAEETGAPAGLRVVAVASHDTQSAIAAVPGLGENWAYLSSGTWSLLGSEETEPIITDNARLANFTNEGMYHGRISLLTNIMGLWVVQQLRAAWTDKQGNAPDYATLVDEAAKSRPFASLIRLDWAPFGKPGRMPEKIAAFCRATNQPAPKSRGEFVRAALESLALAYRLGIKGLGILRDRPITRIHVVGGGCKNALLNQMTADACGVEVLAGPIEATALGNILGQMLAAGDIKSIDDGRVIIAKAVRPDLYKPRASADWDEADDRSARLELPAEKF